MTPYWHDPFLTVYEGDCREVMAQMEPESVHCVVTSPPYWGLRDYGTATWIGGDDGCDHRPPSTSQERKDRQFNDGKGASGNNNTSWTYRDATPRQCRCGAVRQDSQLGLEPTPEEHAENMVAVFREVRRVLRKDGTCWVNLGDSYATGTGTPSKPSNGNDVGYWNNADGLGRSRIDGRSSGLKPKDLVGIPWRVAFALQADGWYLRSDIIWSKPNPMPESVTDRPTKAHEYLFLLSKSPRYYFDAEAVREAAEYGRREQPASTWDRLGTASKDAVRVNGSTSGGDPSAGRNLRSVWTIATQPYPGAHFATFPEKLVEPCILAGTSERGVCPSCGTPWRRMIERGELVGTDRGGNYAGREQDIIDAKPAGARLAMNPGTPGMHYENKTTGWVSGCAHMSTPVPATVLDPFAGSGTTGRVAQRLGRRAVLIDLSGEYLTQAMRRNQDIPLGLETA